jgi:hypothetical protein
MTVAELVEKIKTQGENIQFSEIIETVDAHFNFIPTAFKNGEIMNEANQNNGSCKVFSLAKMQNLTKEETLACFGDYYRKDVLENPEGTDHQNIRNFIKFGWEGIVFDGEALSEKILFLTPPNSYLWPIPFHESRPNLLVYQWPNSPDR